MKVALVHDHLAQDGGAEKVLHVFQEMFPDAPTFALVYDPKAANAHLRTENIRTSFLQHFPFAVSHYQWYLTLMPLAVSRYDLSEFDLVLSSSASFAKGVHTRKETLHIDYCHTPTRYLWSDAEQYLEELDQPFFIKWAVRLVRPALRRWDYRAAQRLNVMIANSRTVRERIQTYYHRDARVVYPPVDLQNFHVGKTMGDYFLTGGRLVPYKRFDLVIQACNRLGVRLKIFGNGPDMQRLRQFAGPTITFLGRVTDEERTRLYQQAKAFINAQEEDFGITVVEAMASGRPVIAYGRGGALESIVPGVTGVFFDHQTTSSLASALKAFHPEQFKPTVIRKHAEQFSRERFIREMRQVIDREWERWQRH